MSAPTSLNSRPRIQSRTAREAITALVLQLAAVTRLTVDAVEGRGSIAYESAEYDALIDQSVELQCEILSWVEWDRATPEERKAKAAEAAKKAEATS